MKTKNADFAAAQENWKQKTADHEELAELKKQENDKLADLLKIKELTSTVSDLESKLKSSQSKLQKLNEKLLASSKG